MDLRRLYLTGCVLVLSGCASAKLTVVQALPSPEEKVTLSIEHVPPIEISPAQESEFRTILTSRLRESGVTVVSGGRSDVHDVNGEVAKFRPGVRALRYFIGFGAGRGSIDTTWEVRDESDRAIGICQIVGSITMGVFGGNFNDVLEKVGDRLGECLRGGM